MSGQTAIGWKEFPCPECGYDLRARTGPRCPECGAEVKDIVRSHIPWEHRKQLGRVRAFVRTAWWACLSPRKLTGDVVERVSMPAARGFHRISLLLSTLAAMACVLLANELINPFRQISLQMGVPDENPGSIRYLFPAMALVNSWWGLVPLFLSCHFSGAFAARWFRALLALAAGNRRHRRKVARIASYATALMFPQVLLLDMVGILAVAMDNESLRLSTISGLFGLAGLLCILGALALFAVGAGRWVWATGQNRVPRLVMLLLAYPPAVLAMAVLITFLVFWTSGYVAIAIESMMSR